MEKLIIYTSTTCPYCKNFKKELDKENIKYEEKITKDHQEEWDKVTSFTGMAMFPTVLYKNNYYIAGRDFGTPHNFIQQMKSYKDYKFNTNEVTLQKVKTLTYNINMAFGRLDQLIRRMENKLNIKEDEHKSTD